MPLTIRRIAEIAGVSTATVSAALNGKPDVAAATRQRVEAIARQIGYRPHAAARALAKGRLETIGFLKGRHSRVLRFHDWSAAILDGFLVAVEAERYYTLVFQTEPSVKALPPMLLRRAVDGMVLAVQGPSAFLDELLQTKMPVVAANPMTACACDCVRPNDEEGARAAARHLLELGHRRIAYVGTYYEAAAHINQLRWNTFAEVMSEVGLPVNPGGQRIGETPDLMNALMQRMTPTAILCFSDAIALLVMDDLRARGLRIPADVSVMGFDDMGYSPHTSPSLSTMRLPFREIGTAAGRLMLERLKNADRPPREILLPEELMARESTAPPRTT